MSFNRRTTLAAAAGLLAAPGVARAQAPLRWRMVTSWPKNLPGPAFSAQRIADRIKLLSGCCIEVQVFAAGEAVPAFAVHEAVGNATVELGHTASFFAIGREPALAFFTAIPFGFTPPEHNAWVLRRRSGAVGRGLGPLRREALPRRQYRGVHGRLVPQGVAVG